MSDGKNNHKKFGAFTYVLEFTVEMDYVWKYHDYTKEVAFFDDVAFFEWVLSSIIKSIADTGSHPLLDEYWKLVEEGEIQIDI